ncbi:hypothetical protein [Terribacillus saccharophilus]|uniref:hypothetical protein n=1 Tax=Terribacillus saccharophilus TaxID=361277 RepID=UPI002989D709|nr:hypothetical protein [Terribacillus saccharophilus]MCM3227569.1 hypothetical protein [Terribacillus saccharophilus]
MARKSRAEKLNDIEKQLLELNKRKKEMEEKLYISIGKHVVDEMGTTDEEYIKSTLTKLISQLSSDSNDAESKSDSVVKSHEEERSSEYQPS